MALTLCPFMPGRPAVPGSPRAPYKERPCGDTEPRGGVGGSHTPSSVCCACGGSPRRGESLTWGPGGPRSPGRPGLPASPYGEGPGWWHSPTALSPPGGGQCQQAGRGGSDPLPLTSSPFLPGGPAGPRGPMGPYEIGKGCGGLWGCGAPRCPTAPSQHCWGWGTAAVPALTEAPGSPGSPGGPWKP